MPTKSITIRIDEDLLKYLTERAEQEHRTLSNMIISILMTERDNVYTFVDVKKLIEELDNYPNNIAITKGSLLRVCDKMSANY